MQKRILGYLLTIIGLTGMAFAGYVFATGSGDRSNLFEVICYMIVGACAFFYGINYVYESVHSFNNKQVTVSELEEVSPIQQQWRTIHVSPHHQVQVSDTASHRPAAQTV